MMQQVEIVEGQLTNEQIIHAVTNHKVKHFRDNLRYYNGDNPTINDRRLPVVDAPNHKLAVSYARKIIRTIVGYMYKPGLITYSVDDDSYQDILFDVFRSNNEDTKTSSLGRQASIQGAGYELHYTADGPNPYFARVSAENMIILHDYSIEPEIAAAIRIYRRTDKGRDLEVYYPDRVEFMFLPDNQDKNGTLQRLGEEPHEYESVPVVMYENNEEHLGDFEPIKPLIDAYDLLLSDSMNEFDRFAWAYLILKGMSMDPEEVDKMKQRRVIELFQDGEASFLQKDIPSDYIRFMSEWIRQEIHKQTHVPDFTDTTMGTEMTGAAIDRLFYDFEFVAADKEDRFRDGLKRRIELINTVIRKGRLDSSVVDANDVEITMSRNKPQMLLELAKAGDAYAGRVSQKTWLQEFAPFVEDADAEIEAIDEETDIFADVEAEDNAEQGSEEGGMDVEQQETEDVQKMALNGAQVTAAQQLVQSVSDGELPAQTAIELMLVAFPAINRDVAESIIDPARSFSSGNQGSERE